MFDAKPDPQIVLRPMRPADTDAVAEILALAFATKFRFSLGLSTEETAFLIGALYREGLVSLTDHVVAVHGVRILGVAVIRTDGRRTDLPAGRFLRLLCRHLGPVRAVRALAGCVALLSLFSRARPDPGAAYLDSLAVHPGERGRGVGMHLVRGCVRRAEDAGNRAIALHVVDTNDSARRLYRREGFEEVTRSSSSAALFEPLLAPLARLAGFCTVLLLERPCHRR